MFYYKSNRKTALLEVRVQQIFNDADFERMLIFIEALIEDSNSDVVFKVLPELEEQVKNVVNKHYQTFSNFNITVNVV
tara:strand:- start:12553 stop:12786 length:234 start_codon:yes stop_codon:yes gene_type:complete